MNIEADPLGYKLMSRQLSAIRASDTELIAGLRETSPWFRAAVIALVLLAGLALMAGLHVGRFVIIPVCAGIVLGLIFGPLGERGAARGIPSPLVYTMLVLGVCAILSLVVLVAMPILQTIIEAIPRAADRFANVSSIFHGWIDKVNGLQRSMGGAGADGGAARSASAMEFATTAISIVTPALSQIVVLLFTLILFLAGRSEIRGSLAMMFSDRDHRLATLRTFGRIENRLTNYFFAVTAINLGLGLVVAGSFYLLGVQGAVSWGVMAFLFNYLPVVGPLMMKGGLLVFGLLVEPDLFRALLPLVVFLIISLVEANLVTPRIIGSRITMNPLVVFLSVVFWTWLWGFAGAFLAMPLLAIARAVLDVRQEDSQQIPG